MSDFVWKLDSYLMVTFQHFLCMQMNVLRLSEHAQTQLDSCLCQKDQRLVLMSLKAVINYNWIINCQCLACTVIKSNTRQLSCNTWKCTRHLPEIKVKRQDILVYHPEAKKVKNKTKKFKMHATKKNFACDLMTL